MQACFRALGVGAPLLNHRVFGSLTAGADCPGRTSRDGQFTCQAVGRVPGQAQYIHTIEEAERKRAESESARASALAAWQRATEVIPLVRRHGKRRKK
jgi:hypothetical protein